MPCLVVSILFWTHFISPFSICSLDLKCRKISELILFMVGKEKEGPLILCWLKARSVNPVQLIYWCKSSKKKNNNNSLPVQ